MVVNASSHVSCQQISADLELDRVTLRQITRPLENLVTIPALLYLLDCCLSRFRAAGH